MSTIVGNIVISAQAIDPTIPGYVVASALAIVAGGIICGLGLIRWVRVGSTSEEVYTEY